MDFHTTRCSSAPVAFDTAPPPWPSLTDLDLKLRVKSGWGVTPDVSTRVHTRGQLFYDIYSIIRRLLSIYLSGDWCE